MISLMEGIVGIIVLLKVNLKLAEFGIKEKKHNGE